MATGEEEGKEGGGGKTEGRGDQTLTNHGCFIVTILFFVPERGGREREGVRRERTH